MRLLGVSYEAYTANKHSMEGQNFYALSLEECLLKLEPHHFGAVDFSVLGVVALDCAIIHTLSNFLGLALIEVASLAGLTIT